MLWVGVQRVCTGALPLMSAHYVPGKSFFSPQGRVRLETCPGQRHPRCPQSLGHLYPQAPKQLALDPDWLWQVTNQTHLHSSEVACAEHLHDSAGKVMPDSEDLRRISTNCRQIIRML